MRRQLLEECDWTFARKTLKLNLIGEFAGIGDFPDWAIAGTTPPSPSTGDNNNDADDNPNLTADNAVFPWAFIYQYPTNVLYVHKVYNQHSPWGLTEWSGYAGVQFRTWLEMQKSGWELIRSLKTNEYAIACNTQQAICKYTFDMLDASQFSSNFVVALSLKIAQRICLPLTGDKELRGMIDGDLENEMTKAFRLNLSENPEQGPKSSNYEDARNM